MRASESSSQEVVKVCAHHDHVCHKTQLLTTKCAPKKKTVTGVLKGYDQLLNLVLDEVEEQVQGNDIYSLPCSTSTFLNS
jgi:hypothetical protein